MFNVDAPCNLVVNGSFENLGPNPLVWNAATQQWVVDPNLLGFAIGGNCGNVNQSLGWSALNGINPNYTIITGFPGMNAIYSPDILHRNDLNIYEFFPYSNGFPVDTYNGQCCIDNDRILHMNEAHTIAGTIYSATFPVYCETVIQQLTNPLQANTNYVITFENASSTVVPGNMIFQPMLQVVLDQTATYCVTANSNTDGSFLPGPNGIVNTVNSPLNANTDWVERTFLVNTGIFNNYDVLVLQPSSPLAQFPNQTVGGNTNNDQYIDDICIIPTAAEPLTIQGTVVPDPTVCEETFVVTFNVALQYPGPNASAVTLDLQIPNGVVINNGMNFDANGNITFAPGTLTNVPVQVSVQLLFVNVNPGTPLCLSIDVNENSIAGCLCHPPCINITPVAQPAILTFVVEDECPGQLNGSITTTVVDGGNSPSFAWTLNGNPFSTDQSLFNLDNGVYVLQYTDNIGCFVNTFTINVGNFDTPIISDPGYIENAGGSPSNLCSYSYDGIVDATITGGVLPYTYTWSIDGSPIGPAQTTVMSTDPYIVRYAGVGLGDFELYVTDVNGCTSMVPIEITESMLPPEILLSINSSTNVGCNADPSLSSTIDFVTNYSAIYDPQSSLTPIDYALYEGVWDPTIYLPSQLENPIWTSLNIAAGVPTSSISLNNGPDACNVYTMVAFNKVNPWDPSYNWPETENWALNCKDVEYIAVGDIIDLKLDRIVSPFCSGQNGLGSIYVNVDVSCNEAQTYAWVNTANPTVVISTSQDLINVPPAEYELTVTYGPCTETLVYDLGITHIVDGDTIWDEDGSGTNGIISIESSFTTFNENLIFAHDVHVKEGNTWTVDHSNIAFAGPNEIQMSAVNNLIPNFSVLDARNNSVFTTACPTYWDGIQVLAWTSTGTVQTPFEFRSQALIDNCCINYAYDALRNHRETNISNNAYGLDKTDNGNLVSINTSLQGGFLSITNCKFHNNRRDVHIVGTTKSNSWDSYHPTFENCESIVDDEHFTPLKERVLIEGSRGSRIIRCNFFNDDPSIINSNQLVCINAGVPVNYSMPISGSSFDLIGSEPIDGVPSSTISGFVRGVWTSGFTSTLYSDYTYIDAMRFECYRGVFSENSRRLRVYRSDFLDLPYGYPVDPTSTPGTATYIALTNNNNEIIYETGTAENPNAAYGCYAIGQMTDMDIQENLFDHDNSNVLMRYGLVCMNTGTNPTLVRRNTFYRNNFANSFQGQNRNNGTLEVNSPVSNGLRFRCNYLGTVENETGQAISGMENKKDVIIVAIEGGSNQGIQLFQNGGSTSSSADNKWTHTDADTDDIDNLTGVSHTYRRHFDENILLTESSGITLQGPMSDGDCPLTISLQMEPEFFSAQRTLEEAIFNSKSLEWLALVDGGNTESLTEAVIYTTYSQATALYYELMQKSPSLSEEVMIETIRKEYDIPSSLLTLILSANPTAAKSERVRKELDERIAPLDEWQRQQIAAGLNVISQKELLEEEMSNALGSRWDAVNRQIAAINSDGNIQDKASAIIEILDPTNYFSDRQLYIQLLKGNGLIEEALNSLGSIILDFRSDQTMISEIDMIADVWLIEQTLLSANEEPEVLSEEQIEILKNVLFTGGSWSSSEALGILRLYSEFAYIEPLMDINELESRSTQLQLISDQPKFKLFPNPTASFCTFERFESFGDCAVIINDVTGRLVGSVHLKDGQKQALIETVDLSEGTYVLRTIDNEQTLIWTTIMVKQ
jgi:hypothetical protein